MVRRPPRRSSGHALALALVVLVLVGTAGTAIAGAIQLEARASLDESRRIRLAALSDAALAEALAELTHNRGFRGAPERRLDRGTITSRVRPLGLDRYEIEAEAVVAGRSRTVRAEVDTGGAEPRVLAWELVPIVSRP